MRVAILIHGEPRFCVEFDHFLNNLIEYDSIDWYFYLWRSNTPTSFIVGGDSHQVVAPFWQNVDCDRALQKFKENLPPNHNVINLELHNQYLVSHDPITDNYAKETIQPNVWKMWYSQYQCNNLRIAYERENNFTYDVVIKSRPDVALLNPLDLNKVNRRLIENEKTIIIPNNKKCGYNVDISDLIGIGSSENMTVYADIYNQAKGHHQKGIKFHPETMLARHLERNDLNYQSGNFNVEFRWFGQWKHRQTGEIHPFGKFPKWEDYVYISDFGRWA